MYGVVLGASGRVVHVDGSVHLCVCLCVCAHIATVSVYLHVCEFIKMKPV